MKIAAKITTTLSILIVVYLATVHVDDFTYIALICILFALMLVSTVLFYLIIIKN